MVWQTEACTSPIPAIHEKSEYRAGVRVVFFNVAQGGEKGGKRTVRGIRRRDVTPEAGFTRREV